MEATKKSKLLIIGFFLLMILFGTLLYSGMQISNQEQVAQIKQVIADKGGTVQHIEVVPLEESPFTKSGKGNTIFKIDYVKNGKSLTAWYRANNNSSIKKEKEEWIVNE